MVLWPRFGSVFALHPYVGSFRFPLLLLPALLCCNVEAGHCNHRCINWVYFCIYTVPPLVRAWVPPH